MRELFLLDPDVVFLNHGSFGACPRSVFEAWQALQREMERNPVEFLGRRSGALLRSARERLAAFLGASAADLVFVENATTGVNVAARSVELSSGDEVLTTNLEYGACDATWDVVCTERRATVRRVVVPMPFDRSRFAEVMLAAFTPRTRVLTLSHIASTTALVLPLGELIAAARARGVVTVVDGAHAPGQIDVDLDALGADFYTGNCHKWMCAPKNAGFLHVRREHHARVHAAIVSWGYVAGDAGHTGFDAYTGTSVLERRLQWQGTRDPTACLAVPAALDFLEAHDWRTVRQRCHAMGAALMERAVARTGLAPLAPADDFAQMFPLPVPDADAEALRAWLFDHHRIEVPVTTHEGRTFVRVSVQGYNTEADLGRLEAALAAR